MRKERGDVRRCDDATLLAARLSLVATPPFALATPLFALATPPSKC